MSLFESCKINRVTPARHPRQAAATNPKSGAAVLHATSACEASPIAATTDHRSTGLLVRLRDRSNRQHSRRQPRRWCLIRWRWRCIDDGQLMAVSRSWNTRQHHERDARSNMMKRDHERGWLGRFVCFPAKEAAGDAAVTFFRRGKHWVLLWSCYVHSSLVQPW